MVWCIKAKPLSENYFKWPLTVLVAQDTLRLVLALHLAIEVVMLSRSKMYNFWLTGMRAVAYDHKLELVA